MKEYTIIEYYISGETKEVAKVKAESKEEALRNYKSDNNEWIYQFADEV